MDGCFIPEVLRQLLFFPRGLHKDGKLVKQAGSAALYTSAGMPSNPGVFLVDICLTTFDSAIFFQQFVVICIEDMKDHPSGIPVIA